VSLKRELQTKYGVEPKMKMAMGELEILVDGKRVFSHKESGLKPTTEALLKFVFPAAVKQT
jgi:hypothetical protein